MKFNSFVNRPIQCSCKISSWVPRFVSYRANREKKSDDNNTVSRYVYARTVSIQATQTWLLGQSSDCVYRAGHVGLIMHASKQSSSCIGLFPPNCQPLCNLDMLVSCRAWSLGNLGYCLGVLESIVTRTVSLYYPIGSSLPGSRTFGVLSGVSILRNARNAGYTQRNWRNGRNDRWGERPPLWHSVVL